MTAPLPGVWMWQHQAAAHAEAGPRQEPGPVLAFSPHPDDEVIACGGTLARRAAEGHPVRVVFATDGAMSHAAVLGIEHDPAPEELRLIRRDEARAAARALGLGDDAVEFLDFPDTRLAGHLPRFRREVRRVLSAHREVAEVYLPHEVRELNADHRLTGEVAVAALTELGLTPDVYRFVVWDERTEQEFAFTNRAEPTGEGAGAAERPVDFGIAAYREAKRAAFLAHRSQVELYAPGQTRPVVPPGFQSRVLAATTERFWVPVPETAPEEGGA